MIMGEIEIGKEDGSSLRVDHFDIVVRIETDLPILTTRAPALLVTVFEFFECIP